MAAPALSLSPQAQQLYVPWTLASPATKTDHPLLSSSPAHSHPPRSRQGHTLHFLELDPTATRMANRAPNSRLTTKGLIPRLFMTGAHTPQSVTWIEAPLRAPLWTSHLGLPRSIPPPTC